MMQTLNMMTNLNKKFILVRKINDPLAKLYVLFVQSIMPSFDIYKAS